MLISIIRMAVQQTQMDMIGTVTATTLFFKLLMLMVTKLGANFIMIAFLAILLCLTSLPVVIILLLAGREKMAFR